MRQRVINKVCINLNTYDPVRVQSMIIQIEALFVFAIMKSTLSSQRDDPFVKKMLLDYKIAIDSPALDIKIENNSVEKDELDDCDKFNMHAIKLELDHNSLLLMDKKYI